MITRRYEVDNLSGVEINLGRVGENEARTVEFDVRPWMAYHPTGFVVVYVVPPAPQVGHTHGMHQHHNHHVPGGYIALTSMKDGIVSWEITSNDTQAEGRGAVELILYGQGNEVLQSTVVKTKVSRSLSHSNGCGCGPNPNQPWVDQVARMAMAAQDAAERAEAAVESMEDVVIQNYIPDGGLTNQVLGKLSNNDHDIGWIDLPDNNQIETKAYVINRPTRYDFPSIGEVDVIYKAEQEGSIYQWNSLDLRYELLSEHGVSIDNITIIHGGNAYGTD